MKLLFLFSFLAVLFLVVSAWDKEDHEIFDLVSAIEAAEGKGTTFYSWLDIPSTASTNQISKAYRKKSMLLHPDKNPGVKGIQERFSRLGVIAAILRSPEGRTRYDHFYKNGVPKWRGTGYYYSRWRPGMPEVLIFLTLFTSMLQYIVQHMTYKGDLKRIEKIIIDAKLAAWGPKMVPVEGTRRIRVTVGGQEGGAGGRMIEMVVTGGGIVSVVGENGELHPLDVNTATPAAASRTWPVNLTKALLARVMRGTAKPSIGEDVEEADDSSDTASDGTGSGLSTPNNEATPGIVKGGRTGAVKVGGKRRNAPRKR